MTAASLLGTPDTATPGAGLIVGVIAIAVGVGLWLFRHPLMRLYTGFGRPSSEFRRTSAIVSAYVAPIFAVLWGLVVVVYELVRLS